MKLVEIRTHKLKPGTAERFVAAFQDALPLVRKSGVDVVAFGQLIAWSPCVAALCEHWRDIPSFERMLRQCGVIK